MSLGSAIEQYIDYRLETVRQKALEAANYTVDELYAETTKMYDKFIEIYYSYITRAYIRHEQGRPGTGQGINLYRGTQIKKGGSNDPFLDIKFDASDMAGYKRCSADFVLNYVLKGYRSTGFVGNTTFANFPSDDTATSGWTKWSGSYSGKYFSYSGSPEEAFNAFEKDFDDIAGKIYKEEFDKRIGR